MSGHLHQFIETNDAEHDDRRPSRRVAEYQPGQQASHDDVRPPWRLRCLVHGAQLAVTELPNPLKSPYDRPEDRNGN